MNAIPSNSKFIASNERAPSRQEMNIFPLRAEPEVPGGAAPTQTGMTPYSKALAVFKGAFIAATVVFATITLALQAAARFS